MLKEDFGVVIMSYWCCNKYGFEVELEEISEFEGIKIK